MLKSMTGYGREQVSYEKTEVVAEIRSVNHRYYEFSARIPRTYGYLEEKLKSFLSKAITRGKVEVSVSIMPSGSSTDTVVEINNELAKAYISALTKANDELGLKNDLTLTTLFRMSDVFTVKKQELSEDEVWEMVKPAVSAALEKFLKMREDEGEKLKADISSRLDFIDKTTCGIAERSPQTVSAYREKLFLKLSEILNDKSLDESRILTEAAIFADKTAVDEETVRLHSHVSQCRQLLESDEPVGKKLDFLVQEMNREVNTTGSKCQDIEITKKVLELKSEIEKIREQIQNIE